MKKLLTLLAALAGFATTGYAKQTVSIPADAKILIAYYSWGGNTKEVAEAIHEKIGGTLFRIETVQAYPEKYRETVEQAKKEIADSFRPELKEKVTDISQYDIIFIGSPNWWGTITPAVSTFLASYDLKGKTVIPFITHGSGGVQDTIKNLTAQCIGCNVNQNGWVGFSSRTLGIGSWLKDLGFKI